MKEAARRINPAEMILLIFFPAKVSGKNFHVFQKLHVLHLLRNNCLLIEKAEELEQESCQSFEQDSKETRLTLSKEKDSIGPFSKLEEHLLLKCFVCKVSFIHSS